MIIEKNNLEIKGSKEGKEGGRKTKEIRRERRDKRKYKHSLRSSYMSRAMTGIFI